MDPSALVPIPFQAATSLQPHSVRFEPLSFSVLRRRQAVRFALPKRNFTGVWCSFVEQAHRLNSKHASTMAEAHDAHVLTLGARYQAVVVLPKNICWYLTCRRKP
jgi:hypothetical protein